MAKVVNELIELRKEIADLRQSVAEYQKFCYVLANTLVAYKMVAVTNQDGKIHYEMVKPSEAQPAS